MDSFFYKEFLIWYTSICAERGGNTLRSEIHKIIDFIWNKEKLTQQWKEPIIVAIYENGDNTD
jgi:hypothetical protein